MKNISQLPTKINAPDESPWVPRVEKLLKKIENGKSRISLAGGVYQQKGRSTWRVWFPWKGRKEFFNKYLDGTPLYCREQAERVLEKIRAEVDQGTFDPALWRKEKTLQFKIAWEVYQKQCPCGRDRMEARERIFENFLLPYFKDKSLREIEEHHIMEWWSTIPKTYGPENKPYVPSYLKVVRATLRAFLSFHRITRMKMFKFPVVKVPKKTPEWLSRSEQERILEFVPSHHQPIIRFLMAYGCRVSEACNLKKSDIDLEKNTIVFRERKNDRDNTLPVFDKVKHLFKVTHFKQREYVFSTANGEKYTRQVLYRLWIDASEKAKTKIIPLKNATRHSLASQLLESGQSAVMVSRILGNTASVVERSYGSISIQAAGEALRNVHQACTG